MADKLPTSPANTEHDALDDLAGRNPKGIHHEANRVAAVREAVEGSPEAGYVGGAEGGHTVDASGQPVDPAPGRPLTGVPTGGGADHSDAGTYTIEDDLRDSALSED